MITMLAVGHGKRNPNPYYIRKFVIGNCKNNVIDRYSPLFMELIFEE